MDADYHARSRGGVVLIIEVGQRKLKGILDANPALRSPFGKRLKYFAIEMERI